MTQTANKFIGALVLIVIVSTFLTVGVFYYIDYTLEAEGTPMSNNAGTIEEPSQSTFQSSAAAGKISIKINNTQQGDSNE